MLAHEWNLTLTLIKCYLLHAYYFDPKNIYKQNFGSLSLTLVQYESAGKGQLNQALIDLKLSCTKSICFLIFYHKNNPYRNTVKKNHFYCFRFYHEKKQFDESKSHCFKRVTFFGTNFWNLFLFHSSRGKVHGKVPLCCFGHLSQPSVLSHSNSLLTELSLNNC